MTIDNHLDLITSQHKVQPKFMAWLSAALNIVDDNVTMTKNMPSSFDIDSAVGVQLDLLGEIIGRSRALSFQPSGGSPILNDNNYRIALKAKIAQNQWDGTLPQVYEIWDSLFPDVILVMLDNQNMTISALVDGQLDAIATELVVAGYIIPKPMTVKMDIIGLAQISSPSYVGIIVTEIDYITVSTIVP